MISTRRLLQTYWAVVGLVLVLLAWWAVFFFRQGEYLTARIAKTNRMSWVEEELQVLKSPETYVLRPEDAWKRLKMRGGSRKSLAVLDHQNRDREGHDKFDHGRE